MFDNVADLIDKIRLGEDSYLELKEVRLAGQRSQPPIKIPSPMSWPPLPIAVAVCACWAWTTAREVLGIPLERLDLVEDFVRQICLDTASARRWRR